MAVKLAPNPRQQFEDANGNPYVGGKLFTYAAGSSTKQATYTDSTGLSANTNPIILDSAGRTPYGVWLTAGLNYKFVLAPSTDTDPPSSPIFTEDVVSGVNDTATTTSQWIASGVTPTYISATQFTLVGDKTADFHVGRRLKFTVTAGTVYGLITATAYTTLTTVTVVMDSGALDTGLSAVELSILTNTGSSLPVTSYIRTFLDDTDAGAALTTLGAPLNSLTTKTSAYTVVAADRGKLIDCSGTFTLSLTAAATLGAGFSFSVRNSGTGIITIDPNAAELIDGAATITLFAGDSCLVVCSGTAFITVGRSAGKVLQTAHYDTGAVATGTTLIPLDDTIPQQTEGDEYMSLSITPRYATSTLRVDVVIHLAPSAAVWVIAAIFRDATADSIGTSFTFQATSGGGSVLSFSALVTAGSTAATTFKVRAGPHSAATLTFNGNSGGRYFGGKISSSIRITEIAA